MKNRPIRPGVVRACCALAAIFSVLLPAQAQDILWESYIDYTPGELTHENTSGFEKIRVADDIPEGEGQLKDFATGSLLDASLQVTTEGNVDPNDFGANSYPNEGSPSFLLFDGKVDVGNSGLPGVQARDDVSLTLTFNDLDPDKLYNFRGTVSRGGGYDVRWSYFEITGAEAQVEAHVDGSDNQNLFTRDTFAEADLQINQVALNSGDNKAGSLIGWDKIEPGADGKFSIIARQYGGPTPFGDAPLGVETKYGYGLTAMYLAEIESTGNLRIVANPEVLVRTPADLSVTLMVEASSPDAITYQWQKAAAGTESFVDVANATEATLVTANLPVAESGALYRCAVTSGGNTSFSGVSEVIVDGDEPGIASAEGSINFNSVYVIFDEPMQLAALANRANYSIEGLFIEDVTVRDALTVKLHTSPQPKAGTFSVQINDVVDLAGNPVAADSTMEFKTFTFASGTVGLEIWENLPGGAVDDLRNIARFPSDPDIDYSTTAIDSTIIIPDGPKNAYGGRFRAWLLPPETGGYHFFLRGEDNAEFRISETSQFGPLEDTEREADAFASGNLPFEEPGVDSTTDAIQLEAGKKYAVEVLWKEVNGGDRAQLAWRKAGVDSPPAEELEPIPSEFFCYFGSTVVDTDGDGLSDAYEILNGLDASINDAAGDLDEDGLTNEEEHELGTAANLADTDGDGLNDNVETGTGIFVSIDDTGSDPQLFDSDTDTLDDGSEIDRGTDPNKRDTDDDTFADNVEQALNTDPTSAASKPNVIIGVETGAWDAAETWSDNRAPASNRDYVVLNTITAEVSAVTGAFPGRSLTLIGPGMALRANHTDTASANMILRDSTLKIRNANRLDGSLTLNGRATFEGQNHLFVLGAALKGAPILTIQGDGSQTGTIELASSENDYSGLTTITGTDVIASGEGSLGDRSITLVDGGITFGYEYSSSKALIRIRGGDFRLVLEEDVTVADLVGVDENGVSIFSLNNLAGPGPYTAADLLAAFQLEEGVSGDGTLTLLGNSHDLDIDGLSDEWEVTHFESVEAATADADPDGDGLNNLAEEVGGTDPNVFDEPEMVEPEPEPEPTSRPVISAIARTANEIIVRFPNGSTFDIEYSEDLITWSKIASDVSGDYEDKDTSRLENSKGFYRGILK